MSSMLEQAIIDAEALKEAAFKSAETQVLEKYSGEIKEAVTALLEQEDDELALEQPQTALPTDETLENIPLKATEGEELCPCPEDEEVIDLPLDKLVMEIENLRKEQDELFTENVEGEAIESDEEIVLDEETLKDIVQELVEEVVSEESEELDAEEINEKLDVDVEYRDNTPGWAGSSKEVQEEAVEELLAAEQSTEAKEKRADINAALDKMENLNEELNKKVEKTLSENKKLREAVKTLKEHIEDFSVSNAKLIYTNRVLTSDSLNERQKNKIVEAISKTDTVEEAKIVFETLQSTVGSTNVRKPKSLSEAVTRASSTALLSSNNKGETERQPVAYDRWKRLAGLNK